MRRAAWCSLLAAGAIIVTGVAQAAQTPAPAALRQQVAQLQKQVASERADRDQLDEQVRTLKQDSDRAAAESVAKDRQIRALKTQLEALRAGRLGESGSGGS